MYVLAGIFDAEHEFLALDRREPNLRSPVELLMLGHTIKLVCLVSVYGLAPELDAELVLDDGTGDVEVSAELLAAWLLTQGGFCCERTGPLFAVFAGDDVDHTTQGIGAVQGGHGAAHHFNAVNGADRGHPVGGQTVRLHTLESRT